MTHRFAGTVLVAGALLGCTSVSQPSVSGQLQSRPAGAERLAAGLLNEEALQQAQTGQLAEALRIWDKALAMDPDASRLHNNRGYALLLMGRWDEARVSLNLALSLSPPSPQAQANLGLLARLQPRANKDDQSERDKKVESQAQQTQGPTATLSQADEEDPAAPRLVLLGPQVYELRDAPVQSRTPQAIEAWVGQTQNSAHALAAINAARLEVSNGVGVRLLAKRTSLKLAEQGVMTQRLTNTPGFAQVTTELQFNPTQQAAAQALWTLLPAGAVMQPVPRVDHLRLVLGHDAAGKSVLAWLDGLAPVAARVLPEHVGTAQWVSVQDGWQWL